jgi:hypothetical protein
MGPKPVIARAAKPSPPGRPGDGWATGERATRRWPGKPTSLMPHAPCRPPLRGDLCFGENEVNWAGASTLSLSKDARGGPFDQLRAPPLPCPPGPWAGASASTKSLPACRWAGASTLSLSKGARGGPFDQLRTPAPPCPPGPWAGASASTGSLPACRWAGASTLSLSKGARGGPFDQLRAPPPPCPPGTACILPILLQHKSSENLTCFFGDRKRSLKLVVDVRGYCGLPDRIACAPLCPVGLRTRIACSRPRDQSRSSSQPGGGPSICIM